MDFHGSLLINGEPFPASEIESGGIYAVPFARDASPLLLGRTKYGAYDRVVLPGLYQPAFAHTAGATIVPRNTFTTFGAPLRVERGDNRESPVLDLFAANLTGTYEHRGVPMPVGGPDNYQIHLQRDANYVPLARVDLGDLRLAGDGGRFRPLLPVPGRPQPAEERVHAIRLLGARP